uniref:Uncharacterized protein n=1 Tax=Anopheles dirus TaxID=7168 RepID=A0A182NWZ0_9DIPT
MVGTAFRQRTGTVPGFGRTAESTLVVAAARERFQRVPLRVTQGARVRRSRLCLVQLLLLLLLLLLLSFDRIGTVTAVRLLLLLRHMLNGVGLRRSGGRHSRLRELDRIDAARHHVHVVFAVHFQAVTAGVRRWKRISAGSGGLLRDLRAVQTVTGHGQQMGGVLFVEHLADLTVVCDCRHRSRGCCDRRYRITTRFGDCFLLHRRGDDCRRCGRAGGAHDGSGDRRTAGGLRGQRLGAGLWARSAGRPVRRWTSLGTVGAVRFVRLVRP